LNRSLGFYSFFGPVRFTSVNWRRLLSFPSLVPHLLQPTSPHHNTAPCHASFSWSQDELTVSSLSSSNTSSHRIYPQAETKALNSHHHHRPPYPDRPTLTLHYYEKIASTLPTLPTTQSCLHFCLLPSQSTTSSELHPPPLFSFTVIPRSHNDIHNDELANPLLLTEQFIDM
jgi:hypothetical protein